MDFSLVNARRAAAVRDRIPALSVIDTTSKRDLRCVPPDKMFDGGVTRNDPPVNTPETPLAVPNSGDDARDIQLKGPSVRGVSTAAAPFLPPNLVKVQDQQPNAGAAPFIPAVSIKANATPFVPGASSGKPPAGSSSPGDIQLPSDDDFTLGLTDMSAVSRGDGAPLTLGLASQNDINVNIRGTSPYNMQHTTAGSGKVGGGQFLYVRRGPNHPRLPSGMSVRRFCLRSCIEQLRRTKAQDVS